MSILKIMLKISSIIVLILIASNFIWINKKETLLYKIQQYATYSKEDWENYESNQKILAKYSIENDTTTIVENTIDYHPYDINLIPNLENQEQLDKKQKSYEKLIVAKSKPSDEEAQIALIKLTQGKLTEVIINQKLRIKLGKCYENPNTDGNYNCVSCMIVLYNNKTKKLQEAPDGENFMQNAYDFYQPSAGDIWEAKDLSQFIPYDYQLIKRYSQ